ncbi:MAG: hypothetical protein HQ567_30555 [Candidatus Nealsonbacteria bacterium]|nr:hypothetical protein [Candidatus Nealsonbacteria bacterium]
MTWEWYQKRIAEFFRRVPRARVAEDVKVVGRSGVKRQLDVQIFLPMEVKLSEEITVTVDIHIVVDAKKHKKPVEIGLVGQVDDLRDDIGAHLAIIASPLGFTKGAQRRAPKVNVALLVVTSDLLEMLNKVKIPWLHSCQNYLCEEGRGYIDWTLRSDKRQAVLGSCQYCDVLHVLCPDCGAVFVVHEFDEGKPLKCPGCDRIYRAGRDEIHEPWVEVRDELDVMLMAAAHANQSKRISKGKAEKIIGRTKWQHAAGPTRNITASGLMQWTASGEFLCLTEDGREDYETFIQAAEEASQ